MTPYALLLQACGLSQAEAAAVHEVRQDTVKAWSRGSRPAPEGAIEQLRALHRLIEKAAVQAVDLIRRAPAAQVEIGYPVDDYEARTLGFPCVGAWRAMAALVAARIDKRVILSPRGSTLATAAAADAAGR